MTEIGASTSSPFSNGDAILLVFSRAGDAGAGASFTFVTKTAADSPYTITTGDSGIAADATFGPVVLIVPTAVGATQQYAVKRLDSTTNTVTLQTTSGQTINEFSSIPLVVQDQGGILGGDNANWHFLATVFPNPLRGKGDLLVADANGVPQRFAPGADGLAVVFDATQPLGIKAGTPSAASVLVDRNGSNIGAEPGVNFIEGDNVLLAISDNGGTNRIDVRIATAEPGASTIFGLTDVLLNNLQDGDTLSYVAVLDAWVNSSYGFGWDVIDDNTGFLVVDDVTGFQVVSDSLPTVVIDNNTGKVLVEDGTNRRITDG